MTGVVGAGVEFRAEILGADNDMVGLKVPLHHGDNVQPLMRRLLEGAEVEVEPIDLDSRLHATTSKNKQGPAPKSRPQTASRKLTRVLYKGAKRATGRRVKSAEKELVEGNEGTVRMGAIRR